MRPFLKDDLGQLRLERSKKGLMLERKRLHGELLGRTVKQAVH